MHMFTEPQVLALKKHAAALSSQMGITRSKGFEPHFLDWKVLNAMQADIQRSARGIVDKMEAASDSELRSLEVAHDALMESHTEIEREKDIRSRIGDRGARADADDPERAAMRPITPGGEGRGVDDGEEFDAARRRESFTLRSGQSMAEHITRNRMDGDRAVRGLTEGAFFRSMVAGAENDIERRALAEGSDSAGGYTVPSILAARLIDRLRAQSVVFRAGAQTLPLESDHNSIAKVASDPVPAWRLENGEVTESAPTFANVQLVPRSLAVLVRASLEVLEDSLNLETALPGIIAAAMAAEVDRVALLGTGVAPQPRGVMNFTGKTVTSAAAGTVTYGKLIQARTALRTANSDVTAYIMSPRDEGHLAGVTDSTGQPLSVPPAIAEVPRLTTTALPINLGDDDDEAPVFAGDWSRLLIGVRSNMRVEVLKERYMDRLQYGFIAHLRVDIAAEHEAAFTTFNVKAPA